jgi:hypothetical protein
LHGLPGAPTPLRAVMGDPHEQDAPTDGAFHDFSALIQGLQESYGAALQQNSQTLSQLGATLSNYVHAQRMPGRGAGPKPKEPKTYDGDRSEGKLDDHIRDLENWVSFYSARGHWADETEQVTQSATYLTGKMHRMFTLQRDSISTFPDYLEWLRRTFKDANENQKLKDEWQQCQQGQRSVMDYATELIYLRTRIEPQKSDEEVKEHFRTGLRGRLQLALAEHPDWDSLKLDSFIGRADRLEQIELAKDSVRRRTGTETYDQSFAITATPRRRGILSTRPSSSVKPRKGTDEWKKHCVDNNLCFNCGKLGHGARNCPLPRGTTSRPPFRRGNRTRTYGKVQGKERA